MRRRPRVAAAAGIIGTILLLTIVVLLVRNPNPPPTEAALQPGDTPSATPTRKPLTELPTAAATPTTAAQAAAAAKKSFDQLGKGFSSGGLTSGSFNLPGIQGGSAYSFLPSHRVTMTVTSAENISFVGWVVPTAYPKIRDIVKNVGKSWSLTLTAYGDPDYAQIYVQANPSGAPITCRIKVDGRVTAQQSTKGPYGRLYPCQG